MEEDAKEVRRGQSDGSGPERMTAAHAFLKSFHRHGIEFIFANLGTDHTPIIEAAAELRQNGDKQPEFVICPNEFVGLSAAHGYTAVSGDPQAILVHVDVGTQNLGAAVHNAARGNIPVFMMAGLAPVTDKGHTGSRDHVVHYLQDVFDQAELVEQYCNWVYEYRPPADPDAIVVRGLTRSLDRPARPIYVTATREALETSTTSVDETRTVRTPNPTAADAEFIQTVADLIVSATRPILITGRLGTHPAAAKVETLVEFAEHAGMGVIEHDPLVLSFPYDHSLHVGFDPAAVLDTADLVLLVDANVPWVPAQGAPDPRTPVIQIDSDPSRANYPYWDFEFDHAVRADPAKTLQALIDELDSATGEFGREHWAEVSRSRAEAIGDELDAHRSENRLTSAVLSDALDSVIDERTILIEDVVTNKETLRNHITLTQPGSFHSSGGSGLGWAGGAAIGAKMASPDSQVISVVGDGSYLTSQPAVCAWIATAQDAPTCTVIYNNSGWNAVALSVRNQHPDGYAADQGVPESEFRVDADLTMPSLIVDGYAESVSSIDALDEALSEAISHVESGIPAVVDVRLETQ